MTLNSIYSDHGHLFLTLPAKEYVKVYGPPLDPPAPVVNLTAAIIAEAARVHRNAWKAYNILCNTERDIRNQLIASADDVYWRTLRHSDQGYNTCTIQTLLTHMIDTYGPITEAERMDVEARMNVPWEGGPLEYAIRQIRDATDAYKIGDTALSEQQHTDKVYDIVLQSGLLSMECQEWRMLSAAHKTGANAVKHFQVFANDHDEVLRTSTAGYQQSPHANPRAVLVPCQQ